PAQDRSVVRAHERDVGLRAVRHRGAQLQVAVERSREGDPPRLLRLLPEGATEDGRMRAGPRLDDVLLAGLQRGVRWEEARGDDLPRARGDPGLALLQDPVRLGPRLARIERVVRPLVARIRLAA